MSIQEKSLESVLSQEVAQKAYELVLYNDDVNTFDYVIEMLIEICKHTAIQAEQCTLLVHYKGQCTVKTGTIEELESPCLQLLDAGLSAKIE